MLRRQLILSGVAAVGVIALLAGPAAAQYPYGRSENTVGRAYYQSLGPGYTYFSPDPAFAGYRFYPGYYTGQPLASDFPSAYGYYATVPPSHLPILYTTINYPGVYGSYTLGITPTGFSVAPVLTTRVEGPPSAALVGMPYVPSTEARPADRPALVDVRVPAEATLSFQGVVMPQTGLLRQFQSPPLAPGRTYTYDVVARWKEDGREVVRTRRLRVQAGERAEVDFLAGRAEEPRRLEARPLPESR